MENSIRLRQQEDCLILDLIGESINSLEFDLHVRCIKNLKKFKKLYVNIGNLEKIDNLVLEKLKKLHTVLNNKNICIFNINAMNNCVLNCFDIDKLFQLYLTKEDAFAGKSPIINRKFRIV